MATGKPAFAGSNPLTVAQKIVAGSYAPLPATYSPLFHEMVRRLLTVDPQARPDILAVSSLISPLLMAELDRVNISSDRLQQQLAHDQEKHRREKEEWMREKQIWRKWMANTAMANRAQIAAAAAGGGAGGVSILSGMPPTAQRSNSGSSSSVGGGSGGGGQLGASASGSNLALYQQQQQQQLMMLGGLDSPYGGHAAGGLVGVGGGGGGGGASSCELDDPTSSHLHGPPQTAPLFRVSTSQLRPPHHDPLTLLLSQLHKLVHIAQLPPKSTRDLKRSVIGKYKQSLFARPFHPAEFKRELQQVASGSQDFIDPSFELPHLDATALLTSPHQSGSSAAASAASSSASGSSSGASNGGGAGGGSASRLTHEELQLMIEQVLEEVGYYSLGQTGQGQGQKPPTPAAISESTRQRSREE